MGTLALFAPQCGSWKRSREQGRSKFIVQRGMKRIACLIFGVSLLIPIAPALAQGQSAQLEINGLGMVDDTDLEVEVQTNPSQTDLYYTYYLIWGESEIQDILTTGKGLDFAHIALRFELPDVGPVYIEVEVRDSPGGSHPGVDRKRLFDLDSDRDQMPDPWEFRHGLSIGRDDRWEDADADGSCNWNEWIAGTSPSDQASVFQFTGGEHSATGAVILQWSSTSDRRYTLSRATNLASGATGFTVISNAIDMPARPPMNTYTDTGNGAGPHFYRLEVRR